MVKLSLQNRLGKELKQARKSKGWTQAYLASSARLSVPTVRYLERGLGSLSSFFRVLEALGLEPAGRNLSGGQSLGQRLANMRKRRNLSQRGLAALVGVTAPTIVALERANRGRLATLDRVLTQLGAGAYLAYQDEKKTFFTHAGNSSVYHGWDTPEDLLRRLYNVFGTFDLDPCSRTGDRRRAPVRAKMHFTADDDGLALPWFGVVFVNPPYGRSIGSWLAKARNEVKQGRTDMVVALVPARTDTRWWHVNVAGAAHVFLLRGRLKFGGTGQSAPFPSALIIWGADRDTAERVRVEFPEAWHIPPDVPLVAHSQ